MKRRQMKKQKHIIIISSLCLLLCLCVGYAAFNTQLTLKAKGNVIDNSVDITDNVVTEGDGLYEDSYEEGRYIYRGQNPDNYIEFNNGEVWRIISKEADGTYKILKNDTLQSRAFDSTNSNNWARPADLNTYLNGEYLSGLDSSIKDNLVSHTWNIGPVTYDNSDLVDQINDENGTQSQPASVGLITVSEYLRANTNTEQCGNFSLNNSNYSTCQTTDWMYKSGTFWWTVSPDDADSNGVWFVDGALSLISSSPANFSGIAPRPAAYLKSDIILTGSGTEADPFTIA